MSNSAGPKITKDGLVLDFDVANPKSYNFYSDPYASNVSLFLDGESLVDLSPITKTITNNNVLVSTTQSKYQNSSLYFLRTNPSYLSVANHADLNISTGDWTVEFWVYPVSFSSLDTFISLNAGTATVGYSQLRIDVASNGAMYMLCASAVSTWINTSTSAAGTLSTGSWQHIAAVRNGNNFTLYVNGVSKLTYTSASSLYNFSGPTFIGALIANTSVVYDPTTSYIDNLKITKGVARYTSAFTSPPIPSTCTDLTRSKNVGTLTGGVDYNFSNGGSMSFTSASSQYIGIGSPISTATANISMGAWFKTNNRSQAGQMVFHNGSDLSGNGYGFAVNNESTTNGNIRMLYANIAWIDTGYTISSNIWYYGVMNIMSDGSNEFYINGNKVYTGISRTRYTPTLRADIARNDYSGTYARFFNGNISIVQFYNRSLTSTEVYNNFIANRGRFGV